MKSVVIFRKDMPRPNYLNQKKRNCFIFNYLFKWAKLMNIYVGNISHSVSEDTLKELFEKIGSVESVKMITDKFTGMPRGFGFVQMTSSEDAQKAVAELDGYELEGRKIVVNEAREREERPSSGGNRSGGYNRDGGNRGRY